MVPSG
ncbi:hypothetical protein POVCU2_0082050, partial [Plasmodium ovale curtisi]